MAEDKYVWVENLQEGKSRFRRGDQDLDLASHGIIGSLGELKDKYAKDSWIKQAVAKGKLRFLTNEEADIRQEELVLRDEMDATRKLMSDAMAEGASENLKRITKKVSDDYSEGKTISATNYWGDNKPPRTVRRSGTAPVMDDEDPRPILDGSALTERVKEGDWTTEVGG